MISDEDDDEATQPLSLRDAVPDSEQSHQVLSVRDVNLVSETGEPLPPPRGALKTLPPTPLRDGSIPPPPPSIRVEEPPASVRVLGDKPVTAARAATAGDPPKRGWILPAVTVAGVAFVLWRIVAGGSDEPAPTATTAAATATAQPTATVAEPAATTVAENVPPPSEKRGSTEGAPPASATADTHAAAPTAATAAIADRPIAEKPVTEKPAVEKPVEKPVAERPVEKPAVEKPAVEKPAAKPAPEVATPMSDLLDGAASARRRGDYASARDLYGRVLQQSPRNVEANGGMGDVLRAQGDLAGAKASYERALAASPAYVPALLGAADCQWDLGDQNGARLRYLQVVERLGQGGAPARAKERSVAGQ